MCAGWGGVAAGVAPSRKALVRRGAFAAKRILFQTSPLAPGGEGTAGPSRREAGVLLELPQGRQAGGPALPHPGFAGGRVARLCRAALRRERARKEKERDRGRGRARGDARGRRLGERARKREGTGRDRAGRFSTAPADSARRGRVRAQPGRRGSRQGGAAGPGSGVCAGLRLPSRSRDEGERTGGQRRSVLGPAGSMWRPGTAAAAEGHGEEGASHGSAPRLPPASRRDEEGGAEAARRAPAGGGGGSAGAAPPSPLLNPAPGHIPGSRAASPPSQCA